jgi:phosphoribosyl 1,2-cyclic phosphate phosphodiesterase
MTDTLRLTILGSGSSGGVPRVGGDWGVCDPNEPKNRRLRCSLLVQRWRGAPGDPDQATTVLVDTSPDLREQLLTARAPRVDAVLFSHDHADQTHGIDDLRPIMISKRKRVPVFMDQPTRATLTRRFDYCFVTMGGYPAILTDAGDIHDGETVTIDGPGGPIAALPMAQDHGGVVSFGFRFGDAAYSNDVVALRDETLGALEGVGLWIVDALRYKPHPTHAHVEKTLSWIARVKPKRAVLTNLHVDIDFERIRRELPAGVEPAFDGWSADFAVEPARATSP